MITRDKMTWVVQDNLGRQGVAQIKWACKRWGYKYIPVKVIPFSDGLPDVPSRNTTVFYGATNWINTIHKSRMWSPGVFFNEWNNDYTTWSKRYGKHCMNDEFFLTTLKELDSITKVFNGCKLFIRPAKDDKAFAGQVIDSKRISEWVNSLCAIENDLLSQRVIVASPVGIAQEWRTFIVNKKYSTGSRYREYHRYSPDAYVPQKVIDFVEERAEEFSPSPVFVMDVGESGGDLYVIEVGCFNSAGFYCSDTDKLIRDVSEFAMRRTNG